MSSFANEIEISGGGFSNIAEDADSDFVNIGEFGAITVDIGFGDGGFGEGPYGGYSTTIIDISPTVWTNIETP